jgi:hypothetical protein
MIAIHVGKFSGMAGGVDDHACCDVETVLALQSRCFAPMVAIADSAFVKFNMAVDTLMKELAFQLQTVHSGVRAIHEPEQYMPVV